MYRIIDKDGYDIGKSFSIEESAHAYAERFIRGTYQVIEIRKTCKDIVREVMIDFCDSYHCENCPIRDEDTNECRLSKALTSE